MHACMHVCMYACMHVCVSTVFGTSLLVTTLKNFKWTLSYKGMAVHKYIRGTHLCERVISDPQNWRELMTYSAVRSKNTNTHITYIHIQIYSECMRLNVSFLTRGIGGN